MNKTFTRLLTHCKASGNLEKSYVMAVLKFFSIGAYAQNRTVTGTVRNEVDGKHLLTAF